jgi:hypothetical protein
MTRWLLTITEVGMLVYWAFATAVVLNWVYVPPEYMYSNYQNPLIVAWNWSFFPLDVLFAVLGLVARFGVKDLVRQQLLATASLSLMFCAGLMAISFWIIQGSFDPFWWGVNLWLMILSSFVLWRKFHA